MTNNKQRREWLLDVRTRQRNTVFPDTIQNEARFWRNLIDRPLNTPAKVGFFLIAVFFFGSFGTWLTWMVLEDVNWRQELLSIALGLLIIFGPIFAAISWATRRTLKKLGKVSVDRKE